MRLEWVEALKADGIKCIKTGVKTELGLLENVNEVQRMKG